MGDKAFIGITAQEARELANSSLLNRKNIQNFINWVFDESRAGRMRGVYEPKLLEDEVEFLRSRGFKLRRDSICMWYEVDWS